MQINLKIDFTAFGKEIGSGIGQRTTNQGFGSSNTPDQKYALTERDKATRLDHTWFRKHENRVGRWTSPDPYNGSMSLGNPQSFNRYSYVENQPTNFVDPSGLQAARPGEACSYSGKKDGDGFPLYDGTVGNNGRCHPDSTAALYIFWTSSALDLWNPLGRNTIDYRQPAPLVGGYIKVSPDKINDREKERAIQNCLKTLVATKIEVLNRERQTQPDTRYLWSMSGPLYNAIGDDYLPDNIAQNKDLASATPVKGILFPTGYVPNPVVGTFRALGGIGVRSAKEATAGFWNHRGALATNARKTGEVERGYCENEFNKQN